MTKWHDKKRAFVIFIAVFAVSCFSGTSSHVFNAQLREIRDVR
jgi:membrane-anchored glycerophosphoryl diester phosphodiesterase (GDPDase)